MTISWSLVKVFAQLSSNPCASICIECANRLDDLRCLCAFTAFSFPSAARSCRNCASAMEASMWALAWEASVERKGEERESETQNVVR